MKRLLSFIFKRVWFLAAVMALVLSFLFNRLQVADDLLNASRPGGDYVHACAYGLKPFDESEFRRALAYYKTLMLGKPWTPMVQANLGFCYFYLKDLPKSVEAYRKAIEIAPRIYTFYFDLGFISLLQKDYKGAAELFEQARAILPDGRENLLTALNISPKYHDQPVLQEGSLFMRNYEWDKRLIYVNLGTAYLKLEDFKRLLTISLEGIAHFPQDPQLYYYAGIAAFNLGYYQDAAGFLSRAIEIAPNYAEAYYMMAKLMQTVNQQELYMVNMSKAEKYKREGSWKRNRDSLDLHHWHDAILFFQIYR
jgi:tetratricopeptide (TPR) repeat protein